jgi:hypothetical protein
MARFARKVPEPEAAQAAQAAQLPVVNAALQGGDVVEPPPPRAKASLPVALDDVFLRLHNTLVKQGLALQATMSKQATAYEPAQWDIFEIEIWDGGRVKRIDMVARAREVGAIEDYEIPAPVWYAPPSF